MPQVLVNLGPARNCFPKVSLKYLRVEAGHLCFPPSLRYPEGPTSEHYALCTAPLPAKPAARILSKWRDARARFAAIAVNNRTRVAIFSGPTACQTHLSTTAIGKYLPTYLPTYTPTYPCLSTSLHACVSCMQCRNVYTHTKVRTYMQTDRRTASRKESGFRAWRA